MKFKKKLLAYLSASGVTLTTVAAVAVSCGAGKTQAPAKEQKMTDQSINVTEYGVAPAKADIKVIYLKHPAARSENYMSKDGSFVFVLHDQPLVGVKGDWVAIAAEVKSLDDNSLVKDGDIKAAYASVDVNQDPLKEGQYPLLFKWDKDNDNALIPNKFYSFAFYKKDGSEKILFSVENMNKNLNTFSTTPIDKPQRQIDYSKIAVPTDLSTISSGQLEWIKMHNFSQFQAIMQVLKPLPDNWIFGQPGNESDIKETESTLPPIKNQPKPIPEKDYSSVAIPANVSDITTEHLNWLQKHDVQKYLAIRDALGLGGGLNSWIFGYPPRDPSKKLPENLSTLSPEQLEHIKKTNYNLWVTIMRGNGKADAVITYKGGKKDEKKETKATTTSSASGSSSTTTTQKTK
ncbi:hypothetical protein ACXYRO_02500 [Mycoplasma sp. 4013]